MIYYRKTKQENLMKCPPITLNSFKLYLYAI